MRVYAASLLFLLCRAIPFASQTSVIRYDFEPISSDFVFQPRNQSTMSFLRPVNLPTPLIVQSIASIGLGLWLTFVRRPPVVYISDKKQSEKTSQDHPEPWTMLVPASPSPRMADTVSLLGIVIIGLEITYLVSSYMPFEENQFIAASIPVRIFLSTLMLSVCVVHRKQMSGSGFWELIGLAVLDGSAGIWLGNILGRWDGMVRGAPF